MKVIARPPASTTRRTREFVESGRVEQSAQDAKRAVEGKEKAELDRAEQVGKSHAKGEDPALKR